MDRISLFLLYSSSLHYLSFSWSARVLGGCSREILVLGFYRMEAKELGLMINPREVKKHCIL